MIAKYLAKVKSPRCVNYPKIIQSERNSNLISNSTLYTHIPKIKSISQIIVKLEAQWAESVSLTFHSALRRFNTEPSIGASHQISVHFGKPVSDKKIFRN